MKFLVNKELKDNQFLKHLIYGLLVFIVLFLVLDLSFYHIKIGLIPSMAEDTLLGNEEIFVEPILFDSLLLMVHTNLFFSMLALLILSSIYIRVSDRVPVSKSIFHILFISAVLAPISLLFGYFFGKFLIVAWIVLFITWHIISLFLAIKTLYLVYRL